MAMDSTTNTSSEDENNIVAAAAAAATAIYDNDVQNNDNNNTTHDNNNNNNNNLPTEEEEEEENITQQERSSKELAIQTLLQILEANNIEIDDELRRRALGLQQQHLEGGEGDDIINEELSTTLSSLISSSAPRSSTNNNNNNNSHLNRRVSLANRRKLTKRESIFGALFRKHHSDILHSGNDQRQRSAIEREITEEFTERFGQFSEFYTEQLSFECRIVDGSYVVETPVLGDGDDHEEEEFFDNEENQQQNNNNDGNNDSNNNKKTRRRSSVQQQQQQHQLQRQKSHIPTVTNTSTLSTLLSSIKRCITTGTCRRPYETKVIMKDINLIFEEGKMYLILGAPGCGKSTLLKMIAGRLPETGSGSSGKGPRRTVGGKVEVNGVNSKDTNIVWSNIVSYVDQIERLHGYLTVKETIEFAWNCRWGGTHKGPFWPQNNPEADELMAKLDKEKPIWMVDLIMRAVGIKRVQDTYVGNERVRGVSGGEKKRVSVAEMLAAKSCK
jgi:energy-coupling factor transporter ATP-binding protein EcfA2